MRVIPKCPLAGLPKRPLDVGLRCHLNLRIIKVEPLPLDLDVADVVPWIKAAKCRGEGSHANHFLQY